MTPYADSTFYYHYLDALTAIVPPHASGNPDVDYMYVEIVVHNDWSEERVLYKVPSPDLSGGYAYMGGVHQGYLGDYDVSNGGSGMLLS